MYVGKWALTCAALLAAFQAWLWAGQGSLIAMAAAIVLAVVLVGLALRPDTRVTVMLKREWKLPRSVNESERHYLFKVAAAWLVVVAMCAIGSFAVRGTSFSGPAGITLRVFGFVALMMAFQSFLLGFFRAGTATRARR